ncbi:MAG: glycosyltransferase [Leptolyngbya sp. ERB_1_1]
MLFHGFYILSTEPLIVSFQASSKFYKGIANEVLNPNKPEHIDSLPSWFRPKYLLEHIGGWGVPWHRMARYRMKQTIHALQGRSHYLIVNAADEDVVRKRFLMRGTKSTVSIYINEHLYQLQQEPKIYDAIYTAQLAPFKRHALAQKIEKLMIISYGGDLHTFCPELKHADFNREFLPRQELAQKYNQSYAGLCLSAVEGAMLASCEYMLCGIPVVSTPSKGGREEFFNQDNALIVPPEPEAISQAVEYWKNHPPDPQLIREQTLKRINQLRREYCVFIADLIKKGGGGKQDPEKLMEVYFAPPDGMLSRFIKINEIHKANLDDFHLH